MKEQKSQGKKKKKETIDVHDEGKITDSQIEDAILKLSVDQQYWPYIVEYIAQRVAVVDDSLKVLDPFKDPTAVARSQGIRTGLGDIFDFIERIKEERSKSMEEGGKKSDGPTADDRDPAYGKW